jgi:hypothetical protein
VFNVLEVQSFHLNSALSPVSNQLESRRAPRLEAQKQRLYLSHAYETRHPISRPFINYTSGFRQNNTCKRINVRKEVTEGFALHELAR